MISIALADDHAILRKGVAELISKFDNMNVVYEAGDGKELLEKTAAQDKIPDVFILDINMPVMNGYETAHALKKKYPGCKILALSMYDNELSIIKMLRNGANGYVLKDADPSELRNAINEIYQHEFYYSDLVTGRVLKLLQVPETKNSNALTEKETSFLVLCCSEYTYREIAEKMDVSPRTVDGYRESLFQKLDIKSRTGLAIYAIKTGIVSVT
ncbi:MAG: response regulator transcription factor [Flavipsychrobacter sp.]|nr:response regulator transcription factor [Flavipsychrobacter sp.]